MLKTEGIVFRQTRFRESSLILDIYTKEVGLQSFIMNGVFTNKSQRLGSVLQLMSIVNMEVYYQESKNIHRIKEVNPNRLYQRIPFDIKRSATGIFMLEVCRKSLKESDANEELFDFIKNSFVSLDEIEQFNPYFHLFFLVDLSFLLGFNPLDNYSPLNNCFDLVNGNFCPADHLNIYLVSKEDSVQLVKLFRKLPPELYLSHIDQRRTLLIHLISYYKFHLDQFKDIKSLEVYKDIF